jgi:hypothetical protein
MNTIQTLLSAILAALFLIALLYFVARYFAAGEWAQCPECSWWQHSDGLYSRDTPDGWDGVRSEKVCTSCESIAKHKDNLAGDADLPMVGGSPGVPTVSEPPAILSASCPTNLAPLSKVRRETSILKP